MFFQHIQSFFNIVAQKKFFFINLLKMAYFWESIKNDPVIGQTANFVHELTFSGPTYIYNFSSLGQAVHQLFRFKDWKLHQNTLKLKCAHFWACIKIVLIIWATSFFLKVLCHRCIMGTLNLRTKAQAVLEIFRLKSWKIYFKTCSWCKWCNLMLGPTLTP